MGGTSLINILEMQNWGEEEGIGQKVSENKYKQIAQAWYSITTGNPIMDSSFSFIFWLLCFKF